MIFIRIFDNAKGCTLYLNWFLLYLLIICIGEWGCSLSGNNSSDDLGNDIYSDVHKYPRGFKVIGYLPTWGDFDQNLRTADFSKLTHVNIAFGNPDSDGNLEENLNDDQITALVLKASENNVKVSISLGGAIAPSYEDFLHVDNRTGFIADLVSYVEKHDLDGIDIDLEGDNIPTNYEEFVADLAKQLKPEKLLTAALGLWYSDKISDAALAQFDWINVMSYDATGPWAPDVVGQHSPYAKAEEDLNHFMMRDVLSVKLVLGVPFYGYDFKYNTSERMGISYKEIVNEYPGAENSDQVDKIYYNGIDTITEKVRLVKKRDAGGIMIWEITQDVDTIDNLSLLRAIYEELSHEGSLSR